MITHECFHVLREARVLSSARSAKGIPLYEVSRTSRAEPVPGAFGVGGPPGAKTARDSLARRGHLSVLWRAVSRPEAEGGRSAVSCRHPPLSTSEQGAGPHPSRAHDQLFARREAFPSYNIGLDRNRPTISHRLRAVCVGR